VAPDIKQHQGLRCDWNPTGIEKLCAIQGEQTGQANPPPKPQRTITDQSEAILVKGKVTGDTLYVQSFNGMPAPKAEPNLG